jgi:hypothetical protein
VTGWNQTLPGPAAQRRIRDRRDHPGRAAAVPGRPAAGTSAQRPLPGGLRLVATSPSNGERRFILSDEGGRVVRAWRVTGKDDLGAGVATPALVGGDPVVVVGISRETKKEFLYESRSCGWPGPAGRACGSPSATTGSSGATPRSPGCGSGVSS